MRKHTKALATIMAAATLAMASAVTSLANTGWLNVQNNGIIMMRPAILSVISG